MMRLSQWRVVYACVTQNPSPALPVFVPPPAVGAALSIYARVLLQSTTGMIRRCTNTDNLHFTFSAI